jgi:membrane associated rhomboid family serine protease
VAFNPASPFSALGASGAIAGVLGCYLRLFPLARVVVMVPILFFPFFSRYRPSSLPGSGS